MSHQQRNVNNSLYSILLISKYTIISLHSCYFGFSLFLWLLLMYIDIRRAGQPTPVFLPGESHGQRSLAGSMWSQRIRHNWVCIPAALMPEFLCLINSKALAITIYLKSKNLTVHFLLSLFLPWSVTPMYSIIDIPLNSSSVLYFPCQCASDCFNYCSSRLLKWPSAISFFLS